MDKTIIVHSNESFVSIRNTIRSDLQAIKQAFLSPFSHGLIEGQVHRLKLSKRMMYGRAKLDLLEKQVLYHL